jgi:adenylate cyclase
MRWLTHWTTSLLTLALVLFAHYNNGAIVETLRLNQFDLVQQTDTVQTSQDIGIVTIDEAAIERYGQWPWSREVMADIVWQLREAGVGVIVVPVLFSETDRLGGDDYFAETLAGNGVIIAQTGINSNSQNAVPRGIAKIGDPVPYLFQWQGVIGPIPKLGNAADGVGVVNTVPERDGVVRRVPLLMRVGEEVFPSLGIEVIRVATQQPSYQVKETGAGIEAVRVPGFPIINTDPNGRIWLRWNKEFDSISLAENDFSQFAGRTVIIGAEAAGIGGVIASPTGPRYNWEPAAVTLQTLIDGEQIERPYWAFQAELAGTLVLGLAVILLGRFTPYWMVGVGMIVLGSGAVYGVLFAWQNYLYLLDGTMAIIAISLVGLHSIFLRFVKEFREKQAIKKQFAGYASPTVVKLLQENPAIIKQGVKKDISIVFSDLRGFTPLGESFGDDVKGLTTLMNGYMDAITEPVLDNNGMIIKYIGDASMHIHGAPLDDDNHAHTAVETGLAMIRAVEKFNDIITSQGRPAVGMGAGINSGTGYLGEMGSTKRHSYDVLGDSVSTAARIESKCKEYGCLLLVGEDTVKQCENDFFFLKIDDLAVKGKSYGIGIYTVLDTHGADIGAFTLAQQEHEKMHELYRAQKFDLAQELCETLKSEFDDKMTAYYEMWQTRCEFMSKQALPEDWNGVFVADSK